MSPYQLLVGYFIPVENPISRPEKGKRGRKKADVDEGSKGQKRKKKEQKELANDTLYIL